MTVCVLKGILDAWECRAWGSKDFRSAAAVVLRQVIDAGNIQAHPEQSQNSSAARIGGLIGSKTITKTATSACPSQGPYA